MKLCLISATGSGNVTLSRTRVLASPLESALTKNASASPLGSALAKSLDLNPPGIILLQKTRGVPLHPASLLQPFSSAAYSQRRRPLASAPNAALPPPYQATEGQSVRLQSRHAQGKLKL